MSLDLFHEADTVAAAAVVVFVVVREDIGVIVKGHPAHELLVHHCTGAASLTGRTEKPMQRHQLLRLSLRRVEQSRRAAAPHFGSLPESPPGPLGKRIAGHIILLSLFIGYVHAETLTSDAYA